MSCRPLIKSLGQRLPKIKGRLLPGLTARRPPQSWGSDPVFAYVLTSLELTSGGFVQKGCAPNVEGGIITLCTCMHHHRTWWGSWKNIWVAGFSGRNSGNQLFYLMRIRDEYDSQLDLWSALPPSVRAVKSARTNRLGDLFEPRATAHAAAYNPASYHPPVSSPVGAEHVHWSTAWLQDICWRYPTPATKMPKLLVGDPDYSFVWSRPRYSFNGTKHPRFKVYPSVAAFYAVLK
jgi:hypothetical protein